MAEKFCDRCHGLYIHPEADCRRWKWLDFILRPKRKTRFREALAIVALYGDGSSIEPHAKLRKRYDEARRLLKKKIA